MSSSVTLKALGLSTSPNQIELPNGSLNQAKNIVIRRNDVVEPRRGFKLYGNSFGTSSDVAEQLFTYKGRILRQYASVLQFDSDGLGTFSSFNGTFTPAEAGLRTKSIESNGNFYFTSSDGIKVISAANASQLSTASGYIINAGVPKAIDFTAVPIPPPVGAIGFLPQDSAVAYRTVWGLRDANNNTKFGAPSQPIAVYSPLLSLLIPDLLNTLEALNNIEISPTASFFASGFNYVNSFKVPMNATSVQVGTALTGLAAQIDTDIIYANDTGSGSVPLTISSAAAPSNDIVRISFSSGDPSLYFSTNDNTNLIFLAGFGLGVPTGEDINGAQTIVAVSSTTIDFNFTGAVSGDTFLITGTSIISNRYNSIPQPVVQSSPPTASQLLSLQTYLDEIIINLQSEISLVISSGNQTVYITPLSISTSSNVELTIEIPQDITTDYFLQIYRSATVTATLTDILNDLIPNSEETQLVYEAFPTTAEIAAGKMIVDDITPDIFKGANLYTNASTGDGILQANDIPPFALDINRFKNVIFYANTKTRHRIIPFSLVGVSGMVTDALANNPPTITIANTGGVSNTYTFVLGIAEVTPITVVDFATLVDLSYFYINSTNNAIEYLVWADKTGSGTPPVVAGKTDIRVDLSGGVITTATDVASRYRDVISGYTVDFNVTSSTSTFTVTNTNVGFTTDATAQTSGFTIGSITQGQGENTSSNEILLSQNISPAIAVDETARSMVRVINANSNETIYAYYTSTIGQVPGKMILESRSLVDLPFYMVANNTNTGNSFFPDINPAVILSGVGIISIANPTVITSPTHGLDNNDEIIITGSNSTPSINGIYNITVTGTNTFTIPVNVTGAGTKLAYSLLSVAPVSQNEVRPNRIYYSKLQQPEAVPLLNYLDVGATDKRILRIFPLRDSLFIFKEDGLFRISGEVAPFYLSLFDTSCICIAPDSVSVANNLIYGYTQQGVSTVSEAGVSTPPVSRPIDTEILKIASSDYTNFSTATWGIGYESDNSYTVFTVQKTDDDHATIGYRYSNLTNTWTTIDKDSVCGIINAADDKLYLGAGDINYIEQERKSFSRLDFADREISSVISNATYVGSQIQLPTVSPFAIGDVVVQSQLLTVYKYNSLLRKLDLDPSVAAVTITGVSGASTTLTITAAGHNLVNTDYVTIVGNTSIPSINATYQVSNVSGASFDITIPSPLTTTVINGMARLNYLNTEKAVAGDNLRTKLVALAGKLDTDPGLNLTNYSTLIASLTGTINSISVGNPPTITTTSPHGLLTGRYVLLTGTNSTPIINSDWVITKTGNSTFTIPTTINTAGTTGSFATENNSFQDIKGCFNIIINNLNTDSGAAFSNYLPVTSTTDLETNIIAIDTVTKKITLDATIDFIVGPILIFKAIESIVVYAPNTMGDPLGLKQMQEATIIFANKAFTSATLSFSSDLLPQFIDVPFLGAGNGIFGSGLFGSSFFGGSANSAPTRTYFPRDTQRCRYSVIKFTHKVARESYAIYGITITGNVGQSTRAYR